ncbi:EAL domain-containing protein [Radiobacillus deserti]|uniref:EAL domain-containing protein n=1 Tax=Radiobacillus deserti TaxID=2594883 RepID=A0A516KDE2_9BACI|nr:EAL domain-containing protein [Radiobacillus deserti]QDP39425.1 EAL domain-containing protein [Radiobacillus deserti]
MPIRKLIRDRHYFHHFQPVFDLQAGKRIGFEVLLRAEEYDSPELVFSEARHAKRLYELDSGSIQKAIQTYMDVGLGGKEDYLFLNVFPSTILNPDFRSFLSEIMTETNLNSQLVIFEISETESVENLDIFREQINELRKLGFQFAIDDVGKGYSNLPYIIELKPDYVKLDQYFARDIQFSKEKQRMVSYFIHYCNELHVQLVLEGLETTSEVDTATSLGIPLGQGFILGEPKQIKELA